MRRNQLIRHSSETGHLNDPIVRQKPQFSPALAQRPAARDLGQKADYPADVECKKNSSSLTVIGLSRVLPITYYIYVILFFNLRGLFSVCRYMVLVLANCR